MPSERDKAGIEKAVDVVFVAVVATILTAVLLCAGFFVIVVALFVALE